MTAQSKSRFRSAALAVFAAVLLTECSCNIGIEMDPATTVTVRISGVGKGSDRNIVKKGIEERLQAMTDASNQVMTTSSSGDNMTVKLSPVGDVMAFSRQINFGEVTNVDGRTIMVRFLK